MATRRQRIRLLARRFEGDPRAQYSLHKWAMRFWVVNAAVVIALFSFAPAVWAKASILYLVLISIYSCWATEFGAMSAAEAAAEGPVSAFSVDAQSEAATTDQ
jgi:hypothetical protein